MNFELAINVGTPKRLGIAGQTGTQFDGLGHIGIQMGKDGDKSEMRTALSLSTNMA